MAGHEQQPFRVVSGPPWQGIRYFCTTRDGGVSVPPYDTLNLGTHVGDEAQAVAENRRRLAQALPSPPVWVQQVHGVAVLETDGGHVPGPDAQADALLTAQPGQVLAIMTADCLPVVMGDTQGRVLAVAHAGWRGLASGILENTFSRLRERLPQADVVWRAWIGPGIGRPHFEVGAEVWQAFVQPDAETARYFHPKGQADKWWADLPGLAEHRLLRMGVTQVWQSQWCTYARPDLFFSHRRQQPCGRMATLVWREEAGRQYPSDLP